METSSEAGVESRAQAASASVGAALRVARERMALSLGDAARHLRLSVRQVEAIEAGDFARLPREPFLSGFVRNYARLVQIDPEPLVEGLRSSLPRTGGSEQVVPESRNIPFPTGRERPWNRYAAWGVLAALALALLAYEGLQEYRPQRSGEVNSASPAPAPQQPARAPEPPPPMLEAVAPPGPQAVPASRAVVMNFDAESWVEIRDREGRVIFSQLNPAGSTQTVEADPPLSLVVGNASGVRISYRDRPVDLGRVARDDVARFTLE
jgi:cytoskeleton protein RodZ